MNISDDLNNKIILKTIQISSQENIMLSNIEKFYKKNLYDTRKIIDIIKGESIISMRLIDYFVTNYSKKYRINYKIGDNNENFNVFSSYKSQLKAYNKKYFDPFSRGNRIPLFFKDDCIITTIGQLNFFRWFYLNKVHIYIMNNIIQIEENLLENKNKLKNQQKKNNKSVKKYVEKTPSIIQFKPIPKKIDKIQLNFD